MRDFPWRCGPVPGGVTRRLGREKVHVGADRTAVGVEGAASALELGSPLKKRAALSSSCREDKKKKLPILSRWFVFAPAEATWWRSAIRETVFKLENVLLFRHLPSLTRQSLF